METMILAPTTENIALAGQLLRDGRLVALHTETVYGLAANAFDPDAVSEIFAVKGRPQDNPLIVHIAEIDDIYKLVRWFPEPARKLAEAFWPGPLTMVLPKKPPRHFVPAPQCGRRTHRGEVQELSVPDAVTCGLDTVAVRMPSSPVMLAVIRAAGVPLAAPSANRSGRPSPTRASHVMDDLNGKIPLIIDGGACEVGVESTVISMLPPALRATSLEEGDILSPDSFEYIWGARGMSRSDRGSKVVIKILRPGAVTADELKSITGTRVQIDPAVLASLPEGASVSSPGMKYKHYAPRAEVFLVEGNFDEFDRICVEAGIKENNTWAMCFAGEGGKLSIPCIEYGAENDPLEQCANVFDTLRKLDELGVERVYVRAPAKEGVFLAAYNRLLRAAAFRVIQG